MSENQKRLHVQHYYSTNKNSVPEVKVEGVDNENALIDGEIAINHADEKLFIKKSGATDSNDVVTFSSDEKLDEKYAPKKDYVVNGENEGGVHIDTGGNPIYNARPIIHMGEFDYAINGGGDSANGIGVLVEGDIESSGLIVEDGHTTLLSETESGSSSTNGGSVKLFDETVCLNAWNHADYGENFDNTLTLNKDGLIFNDSRVVTEQILGEHDELVKVDENGIANKNEITIGNFEIKNDKPYNYTLEGHYNPYDWIGYTDENVSDCTFIAEYNHEGAKLYQDDVHGGDYWAYEFVVTEAKIYVAYENEGFEDFKWIPFDGLVGNVFPINAAYLDTNYVQDGITPLVFTDDVVDSPTLYFNGYEDTVYDAKFIQTAPFSLKSTSKAFLNGSPVVTETSLNETINNLNESLGSDINDAFNEISRVEGEIEDNYLRKVADDNSSNFITFQEALFSVDLDTPACSSTLKYELISGGYGEIPSLTIDGKEIATHDYVKNVISGGIKFRGIYTELPWDGTLTFHNADDVELDEWKEENLQGFNEGDLIIIAPKHEDEVNEQYGGNPSADPSKEYILTVYETDDAFNYHWELLGETTVVDKRITDEVTRATNAEKTLTTNLNKEISRAKGVEAQKADKSYVDEYFVPRSVEDVDNANTNIDINVTNVHPGEWADIYSTSSIQLGSNDNSYSIIKMSTYDEDYSHEQYEHSLTISAFDGVKVNGSDVITKDNASANGVLVVDENSIANKSELTIGTFEIKNDKPYNYTFEGTYEIYPELYNIVAEYNQQGVVLTHDDVNGEYYAYTFIITESEHEEFIGREIYVNAALLDSDYQSENVTLLEFVDDRSVYFNYYFNEDERIYGEFIRTAPYSLKQTSKALLNGSPVVTVDMLSAAVTVDSALSTTSVKPVQNKVITNKISEIETNFDELNERIDSSKLTLTTWSNLNSLKNDSKLIPGTKYRITDYVATSISENTSCNTTCNFDIIVTAISENELDEVATTISKDGENEEIYKIWYSLTNDSERFAWADTTNGKGVIYRMIDKYSNDIPYDFINILFSGRNVRVFTNGSLGTISINESEYYNTLCSIASSDGVNEGSILGLFNNTKIESTFNTDGKQILNNILLISYGKKLISNITLDKGCYKNILVNCSNLNFAENCYNNYVVAYAGYYSDEISFGIGCHDNFMNGNCHNIKMGAGCSHNMFGYASNCITMEDKVVGNILGATDTYREKPTFGETSFYDVSLVENEIEESDIIDLMNVLNIDIIAGSSIKYCTFKHQSRCNILGNGSQLVTLGMRSHHNIIGEYSTRIQFGDVAYNNILFANGYTKTTDEKGNIKWVSPSSIVSDIVLESRVAYCQVGSKIVSDTPSGNIKIGQKSYKILVPAGSQNVTVGTDVWYVKSDKPLKNAEIKDYNGEINFITNNDIIENIILESGVYENKLSNEPSYVDISVTSNNTHILPKNNSISSGINSKVNGNYAHAFGDSVSNGNYSFSSGLGTAYGKGSVSFGGFYSRNYQTIVINNVSYELSSDKKYTIATCEYTHKGDTNHVNKYPCVGNGLNGCIGYITEITEKATSKEGSGVFKFYIPTTSLIDDKPSNDKFIITNGTHYVSNCSIGDASTTFGILNTAKGLASSTIGLGLQANNAYEFACGKYNLSSSNTVFSVGYGSDDKNRANIFQVNKNGSAMFASDVTASAFYESSDERLKTFGDDIDVDLDKLAELRKSFFTFNSKPEKMELGVSAQEIQKLYPEIVNENSDGYLSVDYSKLSVIALKAIDKLNDKNKELEERLARIEKALNLQ